MSFKAIPNMNYSTLRVRPTLAIGAGANHMQSEDFITDGAWLLKRHAVVKPGPLATTLAIKSRILTTNQACQTLFDNAVKESQITMYIDHDTILETDREADRKERERRGIKYIADERRYVLVTGADNQKCYLNADMVKMLTNCLLPRVLHFTQAVGKPTTPVIIWDGSTPLGLIMPTVKKVTAALAKRHNKAMKPLRSEAVKEAYARAEKKPLFTFEQIEDAIKSGDYLGFCTACGAEKEGCEPDAENYECDDCGAHKVMGLV